MCFLADYSLIIIIMSESEDKKIREKIYKKDLDFSDKIKKEMEE